MMERDSRAHFTNNYKSEQIICANDMIFSLGSYLYLFFFLNLFNVMIPNSS